MGGMVLKPLILSFCATEMKFMRNHGSEVILRVEGCHDEYFEDMGKPSREINLHELQAL